MKIFLRSAAELATGVFGLLAGMALAELAFALGLPRVLPPGHAASHALVVGLASPLQGLAGGVAAMLVGTAWARMEPRRLAAGLTWIVAALAAILAAVILSRPPQAMGPDPGAVAGKALGALAGLWLVAGLKNRRRPDAGR